MTRSRTPKRVLMTASARPTFAVDVAARYSGSLIHTGESIPTPRHFQGNTAEVTLEVDGSPFVNSLIVGGSPDGAGLK